MNTKVTSINGVVKRRMEGRGLPVVLVGLLVFVLVFMAWQKLDITPESAMEPAREPVKRLSKDVWYGPRRSLAVLAFANPSPGGGQTWLSDGITRELLNLLAVAPRLQLAARASSLFFRDRDTGIPAIAQRLTVAHVLQGSVTEAGEVYRLTASLTRAATEEIIWSATWEREKGEIFAVLDEIVAAVFDELNVRPRGVVPTAEAVDLQAWALYLKGRYHADRLARRELAEAEIAYRAALEIEPGYAPAWAGLAEIYLERVASAEMPAELAYNTAREMAQRALELDPDLADGHAAIAYTRRNWDWDWPGAAQAAQRALDLRPGSADLMSLLSMSDFTLGRFEQAIETLEQAIKRDPLQLRYRLRLGLLHEFAGDYAQALSTYSHLVSLNPDYPAVYAYRGRAKIAKGDAEGALAEADKESLPFWQRYIRILAFSDLGRGEEADALLEKMIEEHADDAAFQIAEIHAHRGEIDAAFQWLQRAHTQRDGGMTEISGNPLLGNLLQDSRWAELMTVLALPLLDLPE